MFGDAAFKAQAVRLAVRHGVAISNPELQPAIEVEKRQLGFYLSEARDMVEKVQFNDVEFGRYHEVVGADRYEVMEVLVHDFGTSQDSVSNPGARRIDNGWKVNEMNWREIERLRRAGKRLEVHPHSDEKMHVVINDLTAAQLEVLEELKAPLAIALETTPKRFHAALAAFTVKGHERERALVREVEKQYIGPIAVQQEMRGTARKISDVLDRVQRARDSVVTFRHQLNVSAAWEREVAQKELADAETERKKAEDAAKEKILLLIGLSLLDFRDRQMAEKEEKKKAKKNRGRDPGDDWLSNPWSRGPGGGGISR